MSDARVSLVAALLCVLPLLGQAAEPGIARRFGEVSEARVLEEAGSGENWLVNGGRFSGEHFSPLRQITADNVKQLGLAPARFRASIGPKIHAPGSVRSSSATC